MKGHSSCEQNLEGVANSKEIVLWVLRAKQIAG